MNFTNLVPKRDIGRHTKGYLGTTDGLTNVNSSPEDYTGLCLFYSRSGGTEDVEFYRTNEEV